MKALKELNFILALGVTFSHSISFEKSCEGRYFKDECCLRLQPVIITSSVLFLLRTNIFKAFHFITMTLNISILESQRVIELSGSATFTCVTNLPFFHTVINTF